jgi:prepilin-type N-terminal cleavage/methylation domain-containing protein
MLKLALLRLLTRARSVSREADGAREAGMTLVEMMVAMLVSTILAAGLISTVSVFTKAEANVVNSSNAAASVRGVLLQFQHDVQSANPLDALSSVSAYNDELQLTVQPSGSVVTWQYSSGAQTLTRTVGTSSTTELTNVTNGASAVFYYYDHCGVNQVTDPEATAASIADSTTVVQISLSVADLSAAPYGTTTSVNIMNKPPGDSRCG